MPTPSILLGPIVGGLSHDRANIWARANFPSTLHVWLAKRADLKDVKHAGKAELVAADGCAGMVSLSRLKPKTTYFYAVNLRNSRPAKKEFHRFETFPEESEARSFSFVFGSCYLPPDSDGGQTMVELNRRIESEQLRFGLFLGDQIYADDAEHNGINKIAVTLDDYRSVYAHTWSLPSIRTLLPNLPLFMILDDHEVDDDWRWGDLDRMSSTIPLHNRFLRQFNRVPSEQRQLPVERVRVALKAYQEHQAMHAPDVLLPLQRNESGEFLFQRGDEGSFAYTFTFGRAAFFVMDTRSMRVKKGKKSMLGEGQWEMLKQWLLKVKNAYPVKFLVSSGTILYPFLLDVVRDRWSGFRAERERLFQLLAENEMEGVYVLTGDLHSAHVVSAELKCPSGRRLPIWEFCSTPFEQKSKWESSTYVPMLSRWIGKQKKHFRQTGQNFGVVHVDFDNPTPRVTFTLHYNQDGWKTLPPIVT